jgi:hypothetical protein
MKSPHTSTGLGFLPRRLGMEDAKTATVKNLVQRNYRIN